jgi:hypothetical protein
MLPWAVIVPIAARSSSDAWTVLTISPIRPWSCVPPVGMPIDNGKCFHLDAAGDGVSHVYFVTRQIEESFTRAYKVYGA